MAVEFWGGWASSGRALSSSNGDIPIPRRPLPNIHRPLLRRRFMCLLRRKVTLRKRAWLLALLLFLSLPVGALFWLLSDTGDSPWLRNFNQVREGMTRAEVEKILGPPSWEPPPTDDLVMITDKGKKLVTSLRWQEDGHEAVLFFDEGGVVGMKSFISNSRREKARQWVFDTFGIRLPF